MIETGGAFREVIISEITKAGAAVANLQRFVRMGIKTLTELGNKELNQNEVQNHVQ